VKYVALAVAGVVTGVLISRLLFPVVLDRGGLALLVLLLLLVATLLLVRMFRRMRSGS